MPECLVCGKATPNEGVCDACGTLREATRPVDTAAYASAEIATGWPELPERLAPGVSFAGRYLVVERIGGGGMGEVYKAIDHAVGETVALKLIRPELTSRPELLVRFRRELALARGVTHPNVCRVHDLGETGEQLYISMSYVEGQTLEALIRSVGALSPRQTLSLARQLCGALEAVHQRGIVHRDLKPANVMVDRDGHAILMDFGIARRQDDARLTDPSAVMGTLAYLAPEQVRGRGPDVRSDVFSLGLILYEMLTGRYPPGSGDVPVALRVEPHAFPAPHDLNPDVPPALTAVVARALAPEPADRYQSAVELRQALEVVESVVSPPAGAPRASTPAPPPTPAVARPPASRGRRAGLGLGGLLAAVAVLTAVAASLLPRDASPPTTRLAVLPLANLTGDASLAHLGVGFADVLATRLAGLPSLVVVTPRPGEASGVAAPTERAVRDLGADLVLAGGLHGGGDDLRVTVQLHQGTAVRWGEEYQGRATQALDLQSRIVAGVGEALRRLTAAEREEVAAPVTTSAGAFDSYARARELLERPDVESNVGRAIALLERAIEEDPRFALAHAALGQAYWVRYTRDEAEPQWADEASHAILEALRLDPDNPLVRIRLADVYHGTGRSQAAEEELARVVAENPENDEAHRLLGAVLDDRGGADERAEAELERAVELRPRYWDGYRALGRFYFRRGRYPEALEAYRRITELQPDNPYGFQMVGTVHHVLGELDAASEAYERAIALDDPYGYAWSNVGTIRYTQGRFEEAERAYLAALERRPGDAVLHQNLGDARRKLGRPDAEVRASYRRAVELVERDLGVNPGSADALSELALCQAKLGEPSAVGTIAEALERAPEDARVAHRAAMTYALLGRPADALVHVQRALDLGLSAEVARTTDELESVQGDPAFRALVGENDGPEEERP